MAIGVVTQIASSGARRFAAGAAGQVATAGVAGLAVTALTAEDGIVQRAAALSEQAWSDMTAYINRGLGSRNGTVTDQKSLGAFLKRGGTDGVMLATAALVALGIDPASFLTDEMLALEANKKYHGVRSYAAAEYARVTALLDKQAPLQEAVNDRTEAILAERWSVIRSISEMMSVPLRDITKFHALVTQFSAMSSESVAEVVFLQSMFAGQRRRS